MNVTSPVLKRRVIEEADLGSVVALLAAGFPAHPIAWWRRAVERLRRRQSPAGYPRFGRLLEIDGRVVGVLLTIHAEMTDRSGVPFIRCNLSSWHVESDFSGHAPLLLGAALKDKTVTFLNITPAPHTQAIIEAQGFRPFAAGSLLTIPLLARRRETMRVRSFAAPDEAGWPDGGIVADHKAFGCLCLVVEADDGVHPFVFSPPRRLHRFIPATQLVYCRDVAAYTRFAGALGAALSRHGSALTMVDGVTRLPGVPGRMVNMGQKKYVVGPHPPRPGDLAYTEVAMFS